MVRAPWGIGIGIVMTLAAWLCCSAAGSQAGSAVPAPTPPVGQPAPPVCLPLAVCGCFHEPQCVTARVHENGGAVDILDGEHAGETGHLQRDCPSAEAPPTDCVDYVDPAMICRRLEPADDTSAKYLCSMDDIHLDHRCGFVAGACSVL